MANLVTRILITARDEASSVFSSLQAKVAGVAAAIAGFFGVALFKSSVDSARDFESAMSAVQAAAGATAAELAELRAAAKEAGSSTQYSSVQAASALEELVKSGLSAADAVKALPAALDLATAGSVGLAEAAGYITQAVAGMSLSFEDAGRVADVLAQGANATKTSVEGLGQALSYAAPIANSLGLSLEETVAYLGKFADAGIDASRSGTALNAILAQFIDPSSKFSEALRNSGIRTRDFNQAIRELAAAGPRASEALLAVGTEAGPALRALLNQGIGSLDELVEKLEKSGGSARTFAGIVSKNLDGALKGFSSAWTSLKEDIGTPVLDTLARQVSALSDRVRAFVKDGTATAFGGAFKAAFEAAGKWAEEFARKIDFTQLHANMRAFAADMQAWFTDIGNNATTAGNVLSLAWAAMGTGLATVKTAIYSLGAGMSWLASAFLADLAKITDGLAKITFGDLSAGFSQAAERMREEARAAYAVYEEFTAKSGEAFAGIAEGAEEVNAAWARVNESASAAAPAVEQVKTAALGASDVMQALGGTVVGLGTNLADLGVTSQQVAARLAEISAQTGVAVTSSRQLHDAVIEGAIAFDAATGAWSKGAGQLSDVNAAFAAADVAMVGFKQGLVDSAAGAKQLGDQSGDIAAKIAQLTAQYKEFIAAGDTKGAAKVFVEMQSELDKTKVKAEDTAEAVDAAFTRLGVKSSEEMKRVAESYRRDYEIIRSSGTASAEDIAAAYDAFVKAAIAGSNAIVQSMRGIEAPAGAIATELERAVGAASGHELDALVDKINALAAVGKLSSTEVRGLAAAVEEARDRAEDAVPGIQSIGEAFRKLGVESPESLKRTADAAEEAFDLILSGGREVKDQLPAAFEAYANAAIAANGGVADATIEAQAAQYGFKVETDETAK